MTRKWFLIFVSATFVGCAGLPKKNGIVCQTQPQWFVSDVHGQPSNAIYVCFRDNHSLTWESRPLSSEEILKMSQGAKAK